MQKKQLTNFVLLLAALACSTIQAGDWVEFAVSVSSDDQQRPDIHGNTIVWQQLVEGDWDIYGADITDPENPTYFEAAEFTNDQTNPAIS